MTMVRNFFMKSILLCLLLATAGCATLDITPRKNLTPAAEKQPVTVGIQAAGDRLREVLQAREGSPAQAAVGTLFDKVTLLPPETRYQQPADIKLAYGTDYILSVGINDISVNGDLNPIWFASLPLVFFKVYTPIVTFEPNVSLDVTLRDAASGTVLLQKQFSENSADHFAPSNPSEKVRGLISLTINNALVNILRESQTSIAAARSGRR